MSLDEEELGADYFEHGLGPRALEDYYRDDEEGYRKSRQELIVQHVQRGAYGSRTVITPTLEINKEAEQDVAVKMDALRKRNCVNHTPSILDSVEHETMANGQYNPAYDTKSASIDVKL